MVPEWVLNIPTNVIAKQATALKLDAKLVMAICMTESGGKRLRVRYEQNYKYLFETERLAKKCGITEITETVLQKHSWGLLQIMGGTARWLGFEGHLPELAQAREGVYWGCIYIRKLMDNYPKSVEDAVSSYNQGSPALDEHGFYKNKLYVDRVMGYYAELTK